MEWLKYGTQTRPLQIRGDIILDEWSNGFTVKNAGTSVVILNGDPLQPGESKGFGGNLGEICIGKYSFYFEAIASPPPGYVQVDFAVVTEKFYIPTDAQIKTRSY